MAPARTTEVMTFRFAWPLVFLLMTGCASVSQTVAPLSEAEQRAAKAHADNICLVIEQGEKDTAQFVAGLADMSSVADPSLHLDQEVRFIYAGTEMARKRGCV